MATVVITGCSSGIGLESALAFARLGDQVYATMRNEEKATALLLRAKQEQLRINIKQLDVTQPDSFASLFSEIIAASGCIDVLVNNAGILHPGAFEDLPERILREVMETNFWGPMLLTRAVLPHMRKQNGGYIVMISSLSGIAGLAGDVAYSASKFALEGATEALRHEIDRWGIHVALVQGGQFDTNIFNRTTRLPEYYPLHSPYLAMLQNSPPFSKHALTNALPAKIMAELLPGITKSDGSQLRWSTDDLAAKVLAALHGQNDAERDKFLRGVSDKDWWSHGHNAPNSTDIESH